MARQTKTAQIQIRVTPTEKRHLTRRARAAGMDLSSWMLGRLIPPGQTTFSKLVKALEGTRDRSFVFRELGALLADASPEELLATVEVPPAAELDDLAANQLAAMVEAVTTRRNVRPPPWTEEIPPLRFPWFPTDLTSLRLHLLCNAPPAFRRRNLFVDSTLEDRI